MNDVPSECDESNASTLGQVFDKAVEALRAGTPLEVDRLLAEHAEYRAELLELLPTARVLMKLARPAAAAAEGPRSESVAVDAQPIGDFRLVREIGRGGMGVVYEAEQLSLRRRVALKVLPLAGMLDKVRLARFQTEAYAAANLNHPHIVPVYAVGCDRGVHYYAMQLISGRSLAEAVEQLRLLQAAKRGGQSPPEAPPWPESKSTLPLFGTQVYWETIVRVGADAADALDYAHAQGIVHRDVKPANLLIDESGKLWIADFGLALLSKDSRLTMTGDLVGTLRYMSPEQALGKRAVLDHRADVYSLGATLYELVALQPVYGDVEREELIRRIALEDPRPLRQINRHIPVDLETIIHKAVARDPGERYATARELAEDLRRFLAHESIKARPASTFDRVLKYSRRHQRLVVGALLVLVLLTGVLAASIVQIGQARDEAVAALEQTSELLYVADMKLAYEAFEKGWDDEARKIVDRYRPAPGGEDRRGFEWTLLAELTRPLTSVELAGHAGPVYELAASPDGRTLASVGEDGALRLWDVASRQQVRQIALSHQPLYACDYSPDGRFLAAGGRDSKIYLIDLENQQAVSQLYQGKTGVESLAFSPDGQTIAAGFRYEEICLVSRDGTLIKREPAAARARSIEFVPGTDSVLSLDRTEAPGGEPIGVAELWRPGFAAVATSYYANRTLASDVEVARPSPCGRFVLGSDCSQQYVLILFDRDTGRVLETLPRTRSRTCDLAYGPAGDVVAAGHVDGALTVWGIDVRGDGDVAYSGSSKVVPAHAGAVECIRFLDSNTLATAGQDGFIRLWTLAAATGKPELPPGCVGRDFMASPSGDFLAGRCLPQAPPPGDAAEESVVVVDGTTGKTQFMLPLPPGETGVQWTRADRLCVIAKAREAAPTIYDLAGRLLWRGPWRAEMKGIAATDDLSHVAVIGKEEMSVYDRRGGLVLRRRLSNIHDVVQFSNQGQLLAWGGQSPGVTLLRMDNAQQPLVLDCHAGTTSLEFSPDDRWLASGHADGVIRIWDAASGRLRGELPGHFGVVNEIAFHPDGDALLSVGFDGTLRVWSVRHWRAWGVICTWRTGTPSQPSFALAAGGQRLMTVHHDQGSPYWRQWDLYGD